MKHFRAWLETFVSKLSEQNDNFEKGNQSCMVTEFHMGAILPKMTILMCGSSSYMVTNFSWEHFHLNENENYEMKKTNTI